MPTFLLSRRFTYIFLYRFPTPFPPAQFDEEGRRGLSALGSIPLSARSD